MNTMVYIHVIYLVIGIAATVWVIWTQQRKGRVFLARWCEGNQPLADSWSHLLAVGMYLLHIGCLLLAIRLGVAAATQIEAIELLATKLGIVLLALAVTHFLHIKAFWGLYQPTPKQKPATIVDAEIVPDKAAT